MFINLSNLEHPSNDRSILLPISWCFPRHRMLQKIAWQQTFWRDEEQIKKTPSPWLDAYVSFFLHKHGNKRIKKYFTSISGENKKKTPNPVIGLVSTRAFLVVLPPAWLCWRNLCKPTSSLQEAAAADNIGMSLTDALAFCWWLYVGWRLMSFKKVALFRWPETLGLLGNVRFLHWLKQACGRKDNSCWQPSAVWSKYKQSRCSFWGRGK